MTIPEKYFTEKEALQAVINTLENGFDGYYCDLHCCPFREALDSVEFDCILDEAAEDLELDSDLRYTTATAKVSNYIINKIETYIAEKDSDYYDNKYTN